MTLLQNKRLKSAGFYCEEFANSNLQGGRRQVAKLMGGGIKKVELNVCNHAILIQLMTLAFRLTFGLKKS